MSASNTYKRLRDLRPDVPRRAMFDTCELCGADAINGDALSVSDKELAGINDSMPIVRWRGASFVFCCLKCESQL